MTLNQMIEQKELETELRTFVQASSIMFGLQSNASYVENEAIKRVISSLDADWEATYEAYRTLLHCA